MLKLWAANLLFRQLRLFVFAVNSHERGRYADFLSPLSSSWHSEYFATQAFNNFPFNEQLCQLFSDDNIREKPFLCERFELTITDRLKSRRSEKGLQSKKQGDHEVASRRRLLFLQAKIRQMKSTRASVVTN